jgi:hypothetical protein
LSNATALPDRCWRRVTGEGQLAPRLAAALLGFALLAGAASCVGLLALDGYAGAHSELCSKVEQCFGAQYRPACEQSLAERLEGARASERAAWLVYFADHSCLESCINARRCLDEPPLCAGPMQGCSARSECCGFSVGAGDCGGIGAEPQCCRPEGFSCGGDGECCAAGCLGGICGGIPCKPDYAPCSAGAECCKKICIPGSWTCADQTCLDLGVPCTVNADCCLSSCAPLPDQSGSTCAEPACRTEPLPCDAVNRCCDGLFCVGNCLPVGQFCTEGAQCCQGGCLSNACRADCAPLGFVCTASVQCCSGACDTLLTYACCGPTAFACTDATQCCSGFCDLSTSPGRCW